MKNIKFHGKKILNKDFWQMMVNEEELIFINHLAVARALLIDKDSKVCGSLLGVITDSFEEIPYQEGDYAREFLYFSEKNQDITRILENDFLIQTRTPFQAIDDTKTRHVRFHFQGSTLLQENIGDYYKTTNDESILITGFYKNQLYDVSSGVFLTQKYDRLSVIDKEVGSFLAEDIILSPHRLFHDHLLFKIDKNGQIISRIFSKKENDYLDYGEFFPLCDYTFLRTQELFYGRKPSKGKIYVFEDYKKKRS